MYNVHGIEADTFQRRVLKLFKPTLLNPSQFKVVTKSVAAKFN